MAWKDIAANAQKIIGKGKLPRASADLSAIEAKFNKARADYATSKAELEKTALALQNAFTEAINAYGQYDDVVDGEDFGLDAASPEGKKAIPAATKLIRDWLKASDSSLSSFVEELKKLNRILVDIRRLDNIKI